jgi:hypothetical protein
LLSAAISGEEAAVTERMLFILALVRDPKLPYPVVEGEPEEMMLWAFRCADLTFEIIAVFILNHGWFSQKHFIKIIQQITPSRRSGVYTKCGISSKSFICKSKGNNHKTDQGKTKP